MDTKDLNRMIRDLNASGQTTEEIGESQDVVHETPEHSGDASILQIYLAEVVRRGATDLLLVPGAPPTIRVDGALVPLSGGILEPEDAASYLVPSLPGDRKQRFVESGSVDLAINFSGGRFRINLHRMRRGSAAALRLLPHTIPSIADLGLPTSLVELSRLTRGLILLTGPTGCGKSTTLAAILDRMNQQQKRHIITIEDPVEYEHRHRESIVEQIEVGSDVHSFPEALRAALRQNPDVILVGEMRDLETVSTVLTAAETGHLVLTTAHTNDATQTIHRIIDVFPSDQQPQIRHQLSMALSAIIYQQLLPKKTGRGRVLATEILIATDAVRNHIRKGTLHHLHTEMTLGRKLGMVTLEDSLASLVRKDLISDAEARIHAVHLDEYQSYLTNP